MSRRSSCANGSLRGLHVLFCLAIACGLLSSSSAQAITTYEGGDFRIDGVLVPGLETPGNVVETTLAEGQLVTGTLADGTVVGFGAHGTVQFIASPPPDQPGSVHLPGDPVPPGLREQRSLTVADGAAVPDKFGIGWKSTLAMTGGVVGNDLIAVQSAVDISGGTIGDRFQAMQGSQVVVRGGNIGNNMRISGASHLEVVGGNFLGYLRVTDGSTATIHDAAIDSSLVVMSGSSVDIHGGEFGSIYLDQAWRVPGRPATAPVPANEPVAHADIYGGEFAGGLRAGGGSADVFDGNFKGGLIVVDRAIVNIYNATFGFSVVSDNGILNIHGGEFKGMKILDRHSGGYHINPTGVVHVFGGNFTGPLSVGKRGFLHIHGGSFTRLIPQGLSETTIYGTHFALDVESGQPGSNLMEMLTPNTPYLLDIRQTTLTAQLADGSPFELRLFDAGSGANMSPWANIRLVLVQVPEPATATLPALALVGLLTTSLRRGTSASWSVS